MSQEQDIFEEIINALTKEREEGIRNVNEVYQLLKQKIDELIKRSGRKLITEPVLEISNVFRITGKVILESKEYDEFFLKGKYIGKIKDFDVVITPSIHHSSAGKKVIELNIVVYKEFGPGADF